LNGNLRDALTLVQRTVALNGALQRGTLNRRQQLRCERVLALCLTEIEGSQRAKPHLLRALQLAGLERIRSPTFDYDSELLTVSRSLLQQFFGRDSGFRFQHSEERDVRARLVQGLSEEDEAMAEHDDTSQCCIAVLRMARLWSREEMPESNQCVLFLLALQHALLARDYRAVGLHLRGLLYYETPVRGRCRSSTL
jgi:hypothetical protein